MSGGPKSQNVTQTTRTEIPAFLQPLLTTQANVGMDALNNLQQQLGQNPVAPYDPSATGAQQQYIDAARGAMGPNGLVQNTIDASRGTVNRLNQFDQGAGQYINRMLPTFDRGIQNAVEGEFIPAFTNDTLRSLATTPFESFQLDTTADAALRSAAAGQGFGTPAFDEAVQASIRSAQPVIASTFAGAGSGGLKSGLAQTAMQQAASDAFARLYGDERNRQMGAAGQLGSFQLAGRDQALTGRGQQITAATNAGSLALQQQGLRQQALSTLGGVLDSERSRQLASITSQPGAAMQGLQAGALGLDALGNAADLEQALKDQPIQMQQLLLAASQGLPVNSLLGQSSTQPVFRNQGAGILGGALTGGSLAQMFGASNPVLGAAVLGGGLLGML